MPITSIGSLVTLFFLIIATWKFRAVYQETKGKNVGYLYKSFIFISIALAFLAFAGSITKNLRVIDLLYDIYTLPLLISQAFLLNITFEILRWEKVKKIVFWLFVLAGAVIAIVPTFNMNEALVGQEGPFIFWEDTRGALMNTLMGMAMMVSSLWFFFFFFIRGLTAKESIVRIKAILMSGGMFFMTLLGLVDYIVGPAAGIISISLFTFLFGFLYILCFFLAISYKKDGKADL